MCRVAFKYQERSVLIGERGVRQQLHACRAHFFGGEDMTSVRHTPEQEEEEMVSFTAVFSVAQKWLLRGSLDKWEDMCIMFPIRVYFITGGR